MSDVTVRRTNFKLPEISSFEAEFEMHEEVGKGNFGSVYSATHIATDYLLAVKRLQVEVQSELAELQREISIMQQCDCPFVVQYFGHFVEQADKGWRMYIFMEYCSLGSLRDILHIRKRGFDEPEIALICRFALLGLLYLHYNKKIHRDVKADNLLVNSAGEAKLADFGVSGQMEHTMAKKNTLIGTPVFIAPEVIVNDEGYDAKVDIWSLGITAIELAEVVPPYHNQNPMQVLMTIPTAPPPTLKEQDKWTPLCHSFLAACLTKDPEQRPAADTLLKHPFILEYASRCDEVMGALVENVTELKEQRAAAGTLDESDAAVTEHRRKRAEAEAKLRAEEAAAPRKKSSKKKSGDDKSGDKPAKWGDFAKSNDAAGNVVVRDEKPEEAERRARRDKRSRRKRGKERGKSSKHSQSSSSRKHTSSSSKDRSRDDERRERKDRHSRTSGSRHRSHKDSDSPSSHKERKSRSTLKKH